jgi:hypothetical protein
MSRLGQLPIKSPVFLNTTTLGSKVTCRGLNLGQLLLMCRVTV